MSKKTSVILPRDKFIDGIKRTSLWQALRNIKWNFLKRKIKKYDGKPLTQSVQSEIQKAIKMNRTIHFRSEDLARKTADNWHGTVNKPRDLRFIENAIPVVFSVNDDFAPYMAVMLQSLLDNSNPSRKYHFIVFEHDFSDKSKKYLINQTRNFAHCALDFFNTKNALEEIPILFSKAHLSIDVYSRFLIPYWLENYPKVIYCDSDMIAKADIAELFDVNIQDCCLAATVNQNIIDILNRQEYSSFISSPVFSLLGNWSRYINAGLLVFNTSKFKEMISYQDLFKFTIHYTNRYKNILNDQDILSLLFEDNYFLLPPEWNYCWATPSGSNSLPFQASQPDTKIIHFTSAIKPWKDYPEIVNNPDALAYRNYAKNVPLFYDGRS